MEIVLVRINQLKPWVGNPRWMPPEDLDDLVRSIEEFGFVEPIVVNSDLTVIGGHQRLEAAQRLGMTEVPAVVVDLPWGEARLLGLALNRIQGTWDESRLTDLLRELGGTGVDLALSGFDLEELDRLLAGLRSDEAVVPSVPPKADTAVVAFGDLSARVSADVVQFITDHIRAKWKADQKEGIRWLCKYMAGLLERQCEE
jgi:ParB-like chromosome segregation protein Spo0J